MNVERLCALAEMLLNDEEASGYLTTLRQLRDTLQNQVSDPANGSYPQQVGEYRKNLYQQLSTIDEGSYSQSYKELIRELPVPLLLPSVLKARVDSIFSANQITPNSALDELKKVVKEVEEDIDALRSMTGGFERFGLEPESLDPGAAELSVIMPRAQTEDSLKKFAAESAEIDKIIKCIDEISTGSRDEVGIKTISSSDFMLILKVAAPTLLTLSFIIRDLLKTYDKVLDVKIKHAELKSLKVPEDVLKGLRAHMTAVVEASIEKIVKDRIEPLLVKSNEARSAELRIEAEKAIRKLADRVDRGYQLEVRAEPLPAPNPDEAETSSEAKTERKLIEQLNENARHISFSKQTGEPVLRLADRSDDRGKAD